MQDFRAAVQYGDWTGTAAADHADQIDFVDYLRQNGLISKDEFMVGFEIWIGEHQVGPLEPADITALVMQLADHDNALAQIEASGSARVRKVSIEMPIEQFLGFFKRFNIALSVHGMLTDKRYDAGN